MLHLTDTRKTRRVAIVAAVMTLATAGVAVAQNGGLTSLSAPGGMQTPGNAQSLQTVLTRAIQLHQAARLRQNAAPTGARTSYGAASQAFGEMLSSMGSSAPTNNSGIAGGSMMPIVSSEQAAADVRALKSAARRAGSAADTERLNKAASLYATGTKEFLTGQLREALLETTAEPVVIRGDSRAADEAARKANQPPPKVEAPKPPAPANPAPTNPNPSVPNPNTPPQPVPQQPVPQNPPQDPNNPANPNVPPVPNNPNNPGNPTLPPNIPPDPNNPQPPQPPVPQNPPK